MKKSPVIVWFRQDLRLNDNPALAAALRQGAVLPVYILDDSAAGEWKIGSAARWWLHHSLFSLAQSLAGGLHLFRGNAQEILLELCERTGAAGVYWNRCYEPWRIERDRIIKESLRSHEVEVQSYNGSLLWEPWQVLKRDRTPYKVFTPFYRNGCLQQPSPRKPITRPGVIKIHTDVGAALSLEELALLPQHPWHEKFENCWQPGELGAAQCLERFLADGLNGYRVGRDYPARDHVSRLSPYLHCGELSPNQVRSAAIAAGTAQQCEQDLDHFLSELAWREFSYYQLFHFPQLPERCLQAKFEAFPWLKQGKGYSDWTQGMTGYPIVDAGMRELWETGYMHNRVRMIVASFLVKNQLFDWRLGEKWFRDCLVDADLASNSAGWQWVAGCGADAAPYFRIFNPVTQGRKFDPEGDYVRRHLPELAELPNRYIHSPWEAPVELLKQAGLELGVGYPLPIVDLKSSRERALAAYRGMKA